MAISEERLQILMPRTLKETLQELARRSGVSVGEYIRRLIEAELARTEKGAASDSFPFGDDPIRTGRRRGSVDHDRPGR
jgi:hypothetical protein